MKKELKNPVGIQVQQKKQTTLLPAKERLTVKQPAVLLQTKEILPKEQQIKASTVPTSKITSSLKQNSQTNATTLSYSKANKNELPSYSKMSQQFSRANQIVKNQPTIIEQNKETEVEEVINISIQLTSHSDIPRFAKEIEPLTKRSQSKINLKLDSNFLNDTDFLNFCDVMVKIASKIRNLKWKIYDKFSNEDTSKLIGEVIGKCNTAFSINLNIGSTYLSGKAAESLAFELKKLTNLRILLININWDIRNQSKREEGSGKINQSIYHLRELQKMDYTCLDWEYGILPPKLENYVFQYESLNEQEGLDTKFFCRQFELKVQPLREYLTELSLRKREYIYDINQKQCSCFYEGGVEYEVLRDLLEYSIIYSIENLPYLTFYSDDLDSYSIGEEDGRIADVKTNKDTRIYALQDLIGNLTRSRLEMISIITIYNKQIVNELPLNYKLIITDLLID